MKKKVEDPRGKPEWELLHETPNSSVNKLFEIYATDKKKAKIVYSQDKKIYHNSRVVLFKWSNGDFKVVKITKRFGISITGKMYSSERPDISILYKDKKFYRIQGKNIVQLNYFGLIGFLGCFSGYNKEKETSCYQWLENKFGWLRYIREDPQTFGELCFNTIIRYKLFNPKSALRHMYGCPYPIAQIVRLSNTGYRPNDYLKVWKETKKHLINIENLKVEFITSQYFRDSTLLASSLGKKVNCSWSLKRLKEEHDMWSKQVTSVLLEFELIRELNVAKVYREFANYSGYQLLTTNHDLITEGRLMNHCVATYVGSVDSGRSGIYRLNGYTLELVLSRPYQDIEIELAKERGVGQLLYVGQLKGHGNMSAPKELIEEVNSFVINFNKYEINEYLIEKNEIFLNEINVGLAF